MKVFVVLSVMSVSMFVTSAAQAAKLDQARQQQVRWVKQWTRADESIWPAITRAAKVFRVDAGLLRTIVGREGGNVNPRTLKTSLCNGTQPGWNTQGSRAFGAFQFMLDDKPACKGAWGTFATYVQAAFLSAKDRGSPVPARFKTPASNVGQALTAAYMIANGGLHHWCASMC